MDAERDLHVPEPDHDLRADRSLSLPRQALQYLSLGRAAHAAARRGDLSPRVLRGSQVRGVHAGYGAVLRSRPGPGMGMLLGESDRQRVQVRPLHRYQRALQPVRLLLSDGVAERVDDLRPEGRYRHDDRADWRLAHPTIRICAAESAR